MTQAVDKNGQKFGDGLKSSRLAVENWVPVS